MSRHRHAYDEDDFYDPLDDDEYEEEEYAEVEDDGDGANAQASNVHGAPHVTAPKGTTRWEAQAATASTTTTTRAATSTTMVLPAAVTTTTAGLPFTLRSLAPLRQDAVTLSKVPPLSRHDATQSVAMSPSLSALAAAASGATHSASSGHFSSAAFGTTASQRISPLDHAIPALSPLSLPSLGGASRAMDVRPSSDSVTVARGHVRPPVSSHSLPNELPTEGTTVAPRPSPFAAGLFGDTNDDESDDDNNNIGTLTGLTVNGVVADCSAAAAATTTATSVSSISCHNASSFTTAAAANQAQTIVRHHDAQKLLRGATVSARDTPTNVRPFHFQSPSPDDTVLHAQSRTAHGTQIRTIHTSERQKLVQNSTKAAPSKIKSTMDPAIASAVRGIKQLSTGNVVGSTSGIAGKMDNERATVNTSQRSEAAVAAVAGRSKNKLNLNVVVIGHVDAGKSTLLGHLLVLLGKVDAHVMRKYEQESKSQGKGSFAYAWVLDATKEERDRGVTVDVAMDTFETESRNFTLLDAPGHRDFVPNMISGAAQADAAILVVDATVGEFERGFAAGGQTKEHVLLARSLGVNQLIVAINKMDMVDWSEKRMHEIIAALEPFLIQQAGLKPANIVYIPCSGLSGENLVASSEQALKTWPLRMTVTDVFKGGLMGAAVGGISVTGRIDQGALQVGDKLLIVPGAVRAQVKSVECRQHSVSAAVAGENVCVTLHGIEQHQVRVGHVLCHPENVVRLATRFLAQIVSFDVKIPLIPGSSVLFHRQSVSEPAIVSKLLAILDKSTGLVSKSQPRAIPRHTTAVVEVQLESRQGGIPLETFQEMRDLGRFLLRAHGQTIAAGIVKEILE